MAALGTYSSEQPEAALTQGTWLCPFPVWARACWSAMSRKCSKKSAWTLQLVVAAFAFWAYGWIVYIYLQWKMSSSSSVCYHVLLEVKHLFMYSVPAFELFSMPHCVCQLSLLQLDMHLSSSSVHIIHFSQSPPFFLRPVEASFQNFCGSASLQRYLHPRNFSLHSNNHTFTSDMCRTFFELRLIESNLNFLWAFGLCLPSIKVANGRDISSLHSIAAAHTQSWL